MGINVREFLASDRHLAEESLRACKVFTDEEVQVALELLDAAWMGGVEGDYPSFTLEVDEQTRGFACIARTVLTQSTWHLYWLCVHPEAQGRGGGQALQTHIERFVLARGGKRIVLETSSQASYQSTRDFYRRVGYAQVGWIRDFYKPGDDCVIFCKELVEV